jgi:hypothetical protein
MLWRINWLLAFSKASAGKRSAGINPLHLLQGVS